MLVLSPSNMSSYLQCPLRFYAQSISKEIKWKPSKSKLRGTKVHGDIEKCVRLGWQHDIVWDTEIDLYYAQDRIDMANRLRQSGYKVLVEHEMAINKMGVSCGWWDETALLRAKADIVLVPPSLPNTLYVIDIKTGRKWDEDDFQLRIECLLAHLIYRVPVVTYEYWYVDDGQTVDGTIDFTNGLMPVTDIYDTMRQMLQDIKNNDFRPTRNKFCKWCDFYNTEKCR